MASRVCEGSGRRVLGARGLRVNGVVFVVALHGGGGEVAALVLVVGVRIVPVGGLVCGHDGWERPSAA